jgi:MFS family permease
MMATKSTLFRFVLIIGVVNLFADFTYEGGRSIVGPFLAVLGASGTIVGFVGGFGDFMGYAIRSVSGYVADKTGRYWVTTFVGYVINLFAVPALALAGNWPVAALLIVMERTGRAIRRPSVETMLSYTTEELGRGWVFGLNEALDQVGATAGPLLVALILFLKGGYRSCFAILLVPALLCISTLTVARFLYPQPQKLEKETPRTFQTKGFSGAYWTYLAAGTLIAAGFTGFSLISFHFQKAGTVAIQLIPILYAVAMATAAVAALVFGRLLDRIGHVAALVAFALSAFFAPFVFLGGLNLALIGMILWGIGTGAQDTLLKAVLIDVIPGDRRSTAFGVFDTGFGTFYLLGNTVMGFLYDVSIPALIVFSIILQLAALPVFVLAKKKAVK